MPTQTTIPAPAPEAAVARPGPSLKPALAVVAIALTVVFGGAALALAGGRGSGQVSPVSSGQAGGLTAIPATPVLTAISAGGEPPRSILSALTIPEGSLVASPPKNLSRGVDQFDSAVFLSVGASPTDVVTFYKSELPRDGWRLLPGGSAGEPNGGSELLYERAGSDGYYWEVAVIVTPVSPAITPGLAGGSQTAPTSLLELDLLQVADAA